MNVALELAKQGEYFVLPNPRVGCVIVKNGTIIGRGFHQRYGDRHAEVLAIEDAIKNGYSLKNATMYVTLEPCSHYGKQPPCTEAIVRSGIKKVVVATKDPNPLVNGKGIARLKSAGIEVIVGILENEAILLNKDFFKFIKTNLPYIAVKVAQSLDGKIASPGGERFSFNTEEENDFVHLLRQKYMAVLVSANTVITDNPMLNARFGKIIRQPARVVIDTNLKIPTNSKIVETAKDYQTFVVYSKKNEEKIKILSQSGIKLIEADESENGMDLRDALSKLAKEKIASILVEGGGNLNFSLLKEGLADYWYSFVFHTFIGGKATKTSVDGEGFLNSYPKLSNVKITRFKNSTLIEGDISYV